MGARRSGRPRARRRLARAGASAHAPRRDAAHRPPRDLARGLRRAAGADRALRSRAHSAGAARRARRARRGGRGRGERARPGPPGGGRVLRAGRRLGRAPVGLRLARNAAARAARPAPARRRRARRRRHRARHRLRDPGLRLALRGARAARDAARRLPVRRAARTVRRAARTLLAAALAALPAPAAAPEGAAPAAPAVRRTEAREPCAARDPLRRLLWGDTHVHTSLSFDAWGQGTLNRPADAYRFARGEAVGVQPYDAAGRPLRTVRLRRSLDFAVVTDHAELLGETQLCRTPGAPGHDSLVCTVARDWPKLGYVIVNRSEE